ncbi:HAD family hydrolase [Aporhodopirellula aestuarii]|uniref:Cof-type HAD-IIB family hydrolase n=1 Tax=Aporhodopirellula aestuarii TaxID=2950107 RepID=A0ABT0TXU6_9BACT|nr:HAD family hydrolase [Aporhodopirellula aestuarii]MCM2369083.1 Cof-type HAD-IIB family hydrolase [Aporhodopirellula aestuarii]
MPFRTTGKYDLVICDIDGCLSPESHAPINIAGLSRIAEHNRLAIQNRDRPVVTLCSGRPIGFVECLCRLIQNTQVPCIGENGVWLWRPTDNSFECDPAITDEHLETVHEARKLLRSLFHASGVIQQPGKSASVALYHPDTDYLRSIVPTIAEEFQKRNWPIRVLMTWLYINCDLQHVNKATAIDRLMTQTGFQRERTAGIGDTMGDRFIAERVSWFGCPANSEAEIKEAATYVSTHNEVEGVLDILDQLAH